MAIIPRSQLLWPREGDCFWLIDNQGAEAGLIKGYSSSPDSAAMLGWTHLSLARCSARVWFEYVRSEVSRADGLSRSGLQDEWTQAHGWDLRIVKENVSGIYVLLVS